MTPPLRVAHPPRVFEIAGLAGSGKSTLTAAMSEESFHARIDVPLRMRDPQDLLLVAHSLPRLAPLVGGWLRTRRWPSWTELKLVVYVMEWSRRLARNPEYGDGQTLIDQGPVYALARLNSADRALAGTQPSGRWWERAVTTWASALDVIIWLDAPNEVLLQRVKSREQDHEIKEAGEASATAFLDRYRRAYETVVAALEHQGGPRVLRYDTSRQSADQIAADVRAHAENDPLGLRSHTPSDESS